MPQLLPPRLRRREESSPRLSFYHSCSPVVLSSSPASLPAISIAAAPFGGPVAAIHDDCKIVQLYAESRCSLSLHLDILFAMAEVMAASFEALDRHRDSQSENPHSRLTSPLYPPPPPRKRLTNVDRTLAYHTPLVRIGLQNQISSGDRWGYSGVV